MQATNRPGSWTVEKGEIVFGFTVKGTEKVEIVGMGGGDLFTSFDEDEAFFGGNIRMINRFLKLFTLRMQIGILMRELNELSRRGGLSQQTIARKRELETDLARLRSAEVVEFVRVDSANDREQSGVGIQLNNPYSSSRRRDYGR